MAKRPRHDTLNFKTLAEADVPQDIFRLSETMQDLAQNTVPRRVGNPEDFAYKEEAKYQKEVKKIREKVQNLKVISRAKVTTNRIYCAAYHSDVTKDLLFFGGQ